MLSLRTPDSQNDLDGQKSFPVLYPLEDRERLGRLSSRGPNRANLASTNDPTSSAPPLDTTEVCGPRSPSVVNEDPWMGRTSSRDPSLKEDLDLAIQWDYLPREGPTPDTARVGSVSRPTPEWEGHTRHGFLPFGPGEIVHGPRIFFAL